MEYQKITNLLDNIQNQPSKFRTKNWFEINDESRETDNEVNELDLKLFQFKTDLLLRPSSCDYSDAYLAMIIVVQGTISKITASRPNYT